MEFNYDFLEFLFSNPDRISLNDFIPFAFFTIIFMLNKMVEI